MVDGYKCYGTMSPVEQKRWRNNLKKGSMSKYFSTKYYSFEDFIQKSFLWSSTKQGYDYWEYISKKYIIHDMLIPAKQWKNQPPNVF